MERIRGKFVPKMSALLPASGFRFQFFLVTAYYLVRPPSEGEALRDRE
jgi:hypothetical protein